MRCCGTCVTHQRLTFFSPIVLNIGRGPIVRRIWDQGPLTCNRRPFFLYPIVLCVLDHVPLFSEGYEGDVIQEGAVERHVSTVSSAFRDLRVGGVWAGLTTLVPV